MLRGPQTVGELKARTERLHRFASTDDVECDARPARREGARAAPAAPAGTAARSAGLHLLAEERAADAQAAAPPAQPTTLEQRLAQVESRLAELERRLAERGLL